MKKCGNCSHQNPENADYCRFCGMKFKYLEENINNLIIQHKIEMEYGLEIWIGNFKWYNKYNYACVNFDVKLINEEIKENIELTIEIIGNSGNTIKKYRERIFKTDTEKFYNYEKILSPIDEFNNIKKILIYPEKLKSGKIL